jgi:predicted transcriptional regulator
MASIDLINDRIWNLQSFYEKIKTLVYNLTILYCHVYRCAHEVQNMPQTSTMTVRIPAKVKERLEALAKATDRSKAYLASRAIEEYLEVQEWQVKAIEKAVHEADSPDAQFVDHEEVVTRVKRVISKNRRG